ncbi:MAG: hypothetical protein V4710_21650 [Verrucomicrobiota bacterium]
MDLYLLRRDCGKNRTTAMLFFDPAVNTGTQKTDLCKLKVAGNLSQPHFPPAGKWHPFIPLDPGVPWRGNLLLEREERRGRNKSADCMPPFLHPAGKQ